MNFIRSKIILTLCVIFSATLFSPHVYAAEMYINSGSKEVVGFPGEFQASVNLNTEGENINAVQGKLSFSSSLLGIKEIEDGNSIINFWINQPALGSDGEISFSGITPGGYNGDSGLLFSIVFQTKSTGTGIIGIGSAQALINDGNGTAAQLSTFPLQISAISGNSSSPTIVSTSSSVIPNAFSPEISRSSDIFDDKWFIAFTAQDKGLGIDHYEVMETRDPIFKLFSEWTVADSPYLLSDQSLKSYVFVKAVDKAGNIRMVELQPTNTLPWYENYSYWFIILGAAFILAIIYSIIRTVLWKIRKKKMV